MINRELIRTTLQEVGATYPVNELHLILARVKERMAQGAKYGSSAFICTSTQDIHKGSYEKSVPMRKIMENFIGKLSGMRDGTMFDVGHALDSNWSGNPSDANPIRVIVLEEMIAMNTKAKRVRNVRTSDIDRKRIREALKNTKHKFPVEYLRKVRDLFNERAATDCDAFICWAGQDISKTSIRFKYESSQLTACMNDLIGQFVPGRTVMNVVAKYVDPRYNYDFDGKHPTNRTRAVVLQELIDMNRNRKGTK